MPGIDRINRDVRGKAIAVVTLDQDFNDPAGAVDYLTRHHYIEVGDTFSVHRFVQPKR